MLKNRNWRIAAILAFIYLIETLSMPLVESDGDDGLPEYVFNLVLAIFSIWLISLLALAIAHLVSMWRFSKDSYRQRVLIGWPVCISSLLFLLVLYTTIAFI